MLSTLIIDCLTSGTKINSHKACSGKLLNTFRTTTQNYSAKKTNHFIFYRCLDDRNCHEIYIKKILNEVYMGVQDF